MKPLAELLRQLSTLDTAAVLDADKSLRVLDPGIRPISPVARMIGLARTVRCRGDFLAVLQALDDSHPGEVLMIDAGGDPRAVAGELFSTEAKRRGLGGIVIDGACRDTSALQSLDFPVYARHVSPLAGTTVDPSATQIEVHCGGVPVRPGDIVFGDADGVVVLATSELERVVGAAAAIQRVERQALARMARGESLLDLLNFREHVQARRSSRESALRFTSPDDEA